jgi:glycine dehydrogenase subunit 1
MANRQAMLRATGHSRIDELFSQIRDDLKFKGKLNLPGPPSETEILQYFEQAAAESSREYTSLLGAGAYSDYCPVVVDALLSRSEFFTAYTPYQAELAQGTLQAMLEFQTMMTQLTGQEVRNASLYDGSPATTEAALMAMRVMRRIRMVLARTLNPEYRQVMRTYGRHQNVELLVETPYAASGQVDPSQLEAAVDAQTAAVVAQSPNFFRALERIPEIASIADRAGALLIVTITEPLSLAVVKPTADAHIVCGEAQSFGVPVAFGGPYLGFLATHEKFIRQMPGRLVGQTVDTEGRRGFVLTLAPREQHIRREKATSKICTNQLLCALAATIYISLLDKNGLRLLAEQNLAKAHYAATQLREISGVSIPFTAPCFNEFVVKVPGPAERLLKESLREKIIGGLHLGDFYPELVNHLLLWFTELASRSAFDRFVEVCRKAEAKSYQSSVVGTEAGL